MAILKLRSRRQARPAPRHALHAAPPAAFPGVLETGPFPAVTPGDLLEKSDFRSPLIVPAAAQSAGEADETALFTPEFAEVAPEGRQRPYAPEDSGPPPSAEAPSAWLRAIPQFGPGSRVLETLTGLPFYAGTRHGTPAEGICLGAADDIWLILDTQSAEVLDALEAAVRQARDSRVYGGFRAPAVPADPEAAEHRESVERELDDCLEQARGVLRAAGNLGFLSADLKRRNGEGVMDVFPARAELAHAVDRGDGAAAAEAASAFIDIISELCGDEVACAIANGIVPADEAVTGPEVAPELEAADESGPAVVSEDDTADGQDGPVAA